MMIQSNPPRAEARRRARVAAGRHDPFKYAQAAEDLLGPNRAQRRARPETPGTGASATSNRDNAPRRASRIQQARRAVRLARRAAR